MMTKRAKAITKMTANNGKAIVFVPVGQPPIDDTVVADFREIQKKIGGHFFTQAHLAAGIHLVVAENWRDVQEQPNTCGLYGPFFFAKYDDDGDMVSLSVDEKQKCRQWYDANKDVPLPTEKDMKIRVEVVEGPANGRPTIRTVHTGLEVYKPLGE
jgi:hypothetical protein